MELFSTADVAKELKITPGAVRKLVERGFFNKPPRQIAGSYVFTRRQLEQLKQRGKPGRPPDSQK